LLRDMENMHKIGLIVNPLAGIGGRVGLKGSDGDAVVAEAIKRGGVSEASHRTKIALKELVSLKEKAIFLTAGDNMGEHVAKECGLKTEVVYRSNSDTTTSDDTKKAAEAIVTEGVDLLLFSGGDGTARDVCSQIGDKVAVLGIPAGVKIHSAVYAITPKSAGIAALKYLKSRSGNLVDGEVMDLDEDLYRQGIINTRLYGYMKVPGNERNMQKAKARFVSAQESLNGIATDIINNMKEDVYYVIGAGSTTRAITEILGIESTLIGVDVIYNKQLMKKDVSEEELLSIISNKRAKIVLTVIGGQGHILGRGNQQISPKVIREVGMENIIIVATKEKLLGMKGRRLLVDTGDPDLDASLSGYKRVVTSLNERVICSIESEG
jgi:predicted polyphosphate/ATP-dependent NAD kinase